MKIDAGLIWGPGQRWKIQEIELDEPKTREIRVKLVASGLCHSDEHLVTGDVTPEVFPVIGGHEGSGIVEAVGPGVTTVGVGDHVVLSFMPSCGRCDACVSGRSSMCENGANMMTGKALSDGTFRAHIGDRPVGQMCMLGCFAPYVVAHELAAVKIDEDIPLDKAALVGCGVTTGWGSAVIAGGTSPGDTVVVVGVGGLGSAAVQAARIAGARQIVAIDPVAWKREKAKEFGATHAAANLEEALPLVREITRGRMAKVAVMTPSVLDGELIGPTMHLVGKAGRVVATAVAPLSQTHVRLDLWDLQGYEKQLVGTVYGSENPVTAIPKLLSLYQSGLLKLDEMITRTYGLDELELGYQDMRDGKNIRGVILFD
jgi:S-(hydroxymethyl)glutathione dehydrogenase/alcohol dehydrogenase